MPTARKSDDGELASLYVALMYLVALLGARAMGSMRAARAHYYWLHRPFWAPPAWLFGVAWLLVVYPLRGIALWQLHIAVQPAGGVWVAGVNLEPFILLMVACGVEILWSAAFFGAGGWRFLSFLLVAADAALLVSAAVLAFTETRATLAGAFLVVGAAWVCFAALLALSLWWLNRHRRHASYHAARAAARRESGRADAEPQRPLRARDGGEWTPGSSRSPSGLF